GEFRSGLDAARAQRDLACAARGKRRIMRDEHERHAALGGLVKQKVGDLPAGRLVEIAGGLVGDQQLGLGRQRAGNRHALLLAAGKLARIMRGALGKAHRGQLARRDTERVGMPGKLQRHGDVFERRHVRDQVKRLEDDADIAAAEGGDLVLAAVVEPLARDPDLAGIDPLQPRNHHQQRRLAGAGRPDDAGCFAARNLEADALEHMDRRGTFAQCERYVLQADGGFFHEAMILYELRASIRYGLERMAFKRFYRLLPAAVFTLLLGVIAAAAEPYRIVGFGDSLMAGYQLDAGQSFPEKLEAALKAKGHDVVIANAGVSGDTTSGGLSRLDWSVPDDTDLVILGLGANDMLRGLPPEVSEKNLTAMIERLQQRDIGILLVGMLAAPNLGADYADRF